MRSWMRVDVYRMAAGLGSFCQQMCGASRRLNVKFLLVFAISFASRVCVAVVLIYI